MKTPSMTAAEFRAEIVKIMPGYQWTVHRNLTGGNCISATGIQSSGFNRLSTLRISRREIAGHASYTVKSAGYGTRSPWLHEASETSLARALRRLQDYYEAEARKFSSCASDLQAGRKPVAEQVTP